ncbi:MAG: AMP-binding protein, partial [Thiohalomonadales bacterium]
MNTANIESILIENRQFEADKSFKDSARIKDRAQLDLLHKRASDDYEGFWAELALQEISWQSPFTQTLDSDNAPHYRWFYDGSLNVSYNCIDRHLESKADKTAIIFEGEQGDVVHITFQQLHDRVCQLANGLSNLGIKKGERVIIYMPMVAEAAIAMLACARIGAIHCVVFGGFSAESLKDRSEDAGATAIITADGGHRGGKIIELKAAVDKA